MAADHRLHQRTNLRRDLLPAFRRLASVGRPRARRPPGRCRRPRCRIGYRSGRGAITWSSHIATHRPRSARLVAITRSSHIATPPDARRVRPDRNGVGGPSIFRPTGHRRRAVTTSPRNHGESGSCRRCVGHLPCTSPTGGGSTSSRHRPQPLTTGPSRSALRRFARRASLAGGHRGHGLPPPTPARCQAALDALRPSTPEVQHDRVLPLP